MPPLACFSDEQGTAAVIHIQVLYC